MAQARVKRSAFCPRDRGISAQLFGVGARKGAIRAGLDADIIIVDDQADEVIDAGKFLSKAKYSPFHGRRTSARVDLTMVRGRVVYHNGAVDTDAQKGQLLRRVTKEV